MKKALIITASILVLAFIVFICIPPSQFAFNPNYPISGTVPTIYTTTTRTTGYQGYTGTQLELILKGTRLAGMGEDIAYVCYINDLNELFVINHMGLESAWGSSPLAIIKNNLFGFHAFDRDPFGMAFLYQSKLDSLAEYAAYTRVNYDMPGGKYYVDGTISGMNVHYATDKLWASSIVSMMNQAHVLTGVPLWVLGFSQQQYRSFEQSWGEAMPSWNDTLTVGQVLRDLYKVWLIRGGKVYLSAGTWAKVTGVYTSDAYTAPSPRAYTLMLMKKAWGLQHETAMPMSFYTGTAGQDTIGQYWARLFILYKGVNK